MGHHDDADAGASMFLSWSSVNASTGAGRGGASSFIAEETRGRLGEEDTDEALARRRVREDECESRGGRGRGGEIGVSHQPRFERSGGREEKDNRRGARRF